MKLCTAFYTFLVYAHVLDARFLFPFPSKTVVLIENRSASERKNGLESSNQQTRVLN